jgi:hypothetical protein
VPVKNQFGKAAEGAKDFYEKAVKTLCEMSAA